VSRRPAPRPDVCIIDTAGRLTIDADLMEEIRGISAATEPHYTFLVIDAMIGQDAVTPPPRPSTTALELDGVILSKLDGDARGGAALSVKGVVGKPIAFASTGERLADFDLFHPDRMADRILGMGDVLSLIEQAERTMDHDTVAKGAGRLMQGQFTLDDFLSQLRQVKKMGSLGGLMKLMPGMSKEMRQAAGQIDDGEVSRVEAIVCSMTPGRAQRRHPPGRLPPQPHRPGVRARRCPGGQHAPQAVQGDAEDDEGDGLGQHAQHPRHGRQWDGGHGRHGRPAGRKLAAQAAGGRRRGADFDMLSQLMGDDDLGRRPSLLPRPPRPASPPGPWSAATKAPKRRRRAGGSPHRKAGRAAICQNGRTKSR
jgi:hypothetical protein